MSVKVMGWVWDQDLPQNEKFVLLAYADHADHDGYNIYPSVALIAHKTGYAHRSVQRITKQLTEKMYLVAVGTGPNGVNKYRMPMYGGNKMTPPTEGGDTSVRGGVTPVSPEPSVNRQPKPLTPPPPKGRNRAALTADVILATVIIPDNFHHHKEFAPTWYAFLEHRIEIKKPMTIRGAEMMLKKLGKYGADVAIASLQDSIANGWQGVFPMKQSGTSDMPSRKQSRQTQAREDMDNYLRRDLEKNLMGGTHE